MRELFCRRVPFRATLVAFVLVGKSTGLVAAEFRGIPATAVTANSPYTWFNPTATITALSGDGRTIAGTVQNTGVIYDCAAFVCGVEPFVWSWDSEPAPEFFSNPVPLHLGAYLGQAYPISARSLSHDGQTTLIVAEYRQYESALYRAGQPTLLRPIADPQRWLWGSDMSADASIVVGNEGEEPFRWDESSGMKLIDGLPAGLPFSATKVSGDGNVALLNAQPGFIHGVISLDPNIPRGNAYTWIETTGLTELQPLTGDDFSLGMATSFDGATVVGTSNAFDQIGSRGRGVRWTDGEPQSLLPLTGLNSSIAYDVTADGKTIVGRAFHQPAVFIQPPYVFVEVPFAPAFEDSNARAVVWNAEGEVFDLRSLLTGRHALETQLDGWLLTAVNLISDDGRTIAGRGINPAGAPESWVLRLDRPLLVPEPSCLSILLAAYVLCAGYRGREAIDSR